MPSCWQSRVAGSLILISALLQTGWAQTDAPSADLLQSMRQDAELADVCFVDPQTGWAVGDRGVIWQTVDGGRTWRLQASNVTVRLESVFFLDSQHGWAAGGTSEPGTLETTGVLLRTRDGGRRWERGGKLLLPALRKVKFFDPQLGWALGESSALFPSGVFATDDGGRSWTPLSGANRQGWLTGDFIDPLSGALAGRRGTLAAIRRKGLEDARMPPLGLRDLRRMQLDHQGRGWLVGDGALVLTTEDLGRTWQTPAGECPGFVQQNFDWRALAARGSHVWIAGTPGTRVMHSADGGRTWEMQATSQPLPIQALHFIDEQHGWAVGALGTVLATTDGGRTWRRQRGGGTRAAMLALYSEAEHVPLEVFARLSAGDGYLGVAQLLNRRDVETDRSLDLTLPERARDAVIAAGGSSAQSAWQFPLRQRGLPLEAEQVIDGWDRISDGHGLEHLEAFLVRQLRTWRPDVVFTHGGSGGDPAGHLINQTVLRAVEKAGDPTRLTEQVTQAGLEPWKVKKVFTTAAGQTGTVALETAQLLPRVGRSVADQSSLPRSLLSEGFTPSPPALSFRLAVNTLTQEAAARDFFGGVILHPGGDARRMLVEPPADSLDQLRRAAQKKRNVEALLERTGDDPQQNAQLAGQVGDLLKSLDGSMGGQVLYQMADRYYRNGQWELAAETFDLLATRYPEHPLTASALTWLVQYWSSSEAAWRVQGRQRFNKSGSTTLALDESKLTDWPARAVSLAKLLESKRPSLAMEPRVRFPLAVAWRQQGLEREADRYFLNLRNAGARDVWWTCADGERWLADPRSSLPPKNVWPVQRASKPYLDGKLDDAVWQAARKVPLVSPLRDDAEWPAIAMLAYDDGFLYLAASCRRPKAVELAAESQERPRDADLAQQDRVEFCFDLDRDFVTSYRFTVDHRGWTAERCWNDRAWNPNWFVAAKPDAEGWTIEAAVPLEEITGQFPAPRNVWAVGVQRIVPGVGFQSFSQPAAVELQPEGFGYLLFE